jgi:hypothetical protein
MKVCFVLRGRPGLGHVVPGAALAMAMAGRGHQVSLASYDNGPAFLRKLGLGDCAAIPVDMGYHDYPGLTLYDHGLRWLVPHLADWGADLVVLGGEYVLGAMASVWVGKTAMLVNPEIFEAGPRNRAAAGFFGLCFRDVDLLVPLRPYQGGPVEPHLTAEFARLKAAGPFRIQDVALPDASAKHDGRRTVLIATGGGMSFPRDTASYSDDAVSPGLWRTQTHAMALAAARAALAELGPEDAVFVFGTLDASTFTAACENDPRLHVHAPDALYYRVLQQADLAVLRAGAGALADLDGRIGASVIWPLDGHPEQHQNARIAAETFGSIAVSRADEMAVAVRQGLAVPAPMVRSTPGTEKALTSVCALFEDLVA